MKLKNKTLYLVMIILIGGIFITNISVFAKTSNEVIKKEFYADSVVGKKVKEVIKDSIMAQVVADKLQGKLSGEGDVEENITQAQIDNAKYWDLGFFNKGISSIEGIQHFKNLEDLNLSGNNISDITELKSLVKLKNLQLHNNEITDITPIDDLVNIEYLNLSDNQVSDLTPLVNMNKLTNLTIFSNQISDVSSLKDLQNLKYLYLNNNQISDITSLKGLNNLEYLFVTNQSIPMVEKTVKMADGSVTIENIIKNTNGNYVSPAKISNGGLYNVNTASITWSNLTTSDTSLQYEFDESIEIGESIASFSGAVIQPVKVIDNRNPGQVTNVTGSLYSKYNTIRTTWKKVDRASGYTVYYREVGKNWMTVDVKNNLSYTKSNLKAGKKYEVKVRAYVIAANEKVYSKNYSVTKAIYTLKKPTLKLTRSGRNTVQVNWGNIQGETGYQIYRATSKKGKYYKVKTLNAKYSKWKDGRKKRGQRYYYKVRAYVKVGNKYIYGPFSTLKSVKR